MSFYTESSSVDRIVSILYKNYRGETAVREIIPMFLEFKGSEWHPEEQWLLAAYDLDKKAVRSFAMADILEWKVPEPVKGETK